MSSAIVRVDPQAIRYKLDRIDDIKPGPLDGDWDIARRALIENTEKHRSVRQHFVDGVPWAETEIFRGGYARRFARGDKVRGCANVADLIEAYHERCDPVWESLKRDGWIERVDGVVQAPRAYLARDGEVILGNDGNHRIAMAKLLGLTWVLVRVETWHASLGADALRNLPSIRIPPELPEGATSIPAMTRPAEQFAFYQLAKEMAPQGAVVELGTWLGAGTVWLAAGVRDSGSRRRMHTWDRFRWQPIHAYKAGGDLKVPMIEQVRRNLGNLAPLVEIHQGEIIQAEWSGGQIALLVADGPKRLREIAAMLSIFGPHMGPGAKLACQDLAYFPAYDLLAAFDVLEQDGAVEFLNFVCPGTTGVVRLTRSLTGDDIPRSVRDWTPQRIERTWERWIARVPSAELKAKLKCGAAMFLYDNGYHAEAIDLFREVLRTARRHVEEKWQYFREHRRSFVERYPAFFAAL